MFSFDIIGLFGLTIDMLLAMSTLLIAVLLKKLILTYKENNSQIKIERTLKVIDFPENISKNFYKIASEKCLSDEYYLDSAALISTLSYFENLAAGIRYGLYEEKIVFDRIGSILPEFYFSVKDEIYVMRSKGINSSFYFQLEWLTRNWLDNPPKRVEVL